MATYAIGDLQGCITPFQHLLDKIQFDPAYDFLWLTGDIVNRGPSSLEALRLTKSLNAKIVLGNHDLHLLAVAAGAQKVSKTDTFSDILKASDRDELLNWLQSQPLLHYEQGYIMVHAGLAPNWDLHTAQRLANEVESVLQSSQAVKFLQSMYGNTPDLWNSDLKGHARLRCIINYFTRVRFCYADGRMNLTEKGNTIAMGLVPWFSLPNRATQREKIIFGHWAALNGLTHTANIFALDTGCVWGGCLTAMRLEDHSQFSVTCQ